MEDDQKKWKTNHLTKINRIGCDTIVNSPSFCLLLKIIFKLGPSFKGWKEVQLIISQHCINT